MAEIHLHDVSKTYANGVCAVANLNLHIDDGELLVLVGPSGCGKTTTLRLIAGLEEPTAGQIHIAGRPMEGVPPWQRGVAMVFQKPTLSPGKSVRKNLNFGNDMRRGLFGWLLAGLEDQRARERRAVEEVAGRLGLLPVMEHRPAELSGGQLQRVALGRMLVRAAMERGRAAPVQLLDEPLGQLDGPLRRQLRRELHLLHRQFPATMVHVTHDSEEALALGDRIAVMHHGVLLQVDSAEALASRPRYRFVAEFFPTAAGPMNFLPGQIVEDGAAPVLRMGPWQLPAPPSRREIWRKNMGRPVLLAVRPDDVCIQWQQTGLVNAWPMRMILVEPRTDGALAICEADAIRLAALVQPGQCKEMVVENEVFVEMRLERSMLFEPNSGVNLEVPD